MLTRAWGHFDKSELSKFTPRFSTMVIPIESLITVDFYSHSHNTLKKVNSFLQKNQLRSILSRSSELNASRFFKISFNADFDFDDELRRFFNFGENEDFRSKLGVNDLRKMVFFAVKEIFGAIFEVGPYLV